MTVNSNTLKAAQAAQLLVLRPQNGPAVRAAGPRSCGPGHAVSTELGAPEAAHFRAAGDLLVLGRHVSALLGEATERSRELAEWLINMAGAAEDLQRWILDGKPLSEGPYSSTAARDVEEIDTLLYHCDNFPNEFSDPDDESAQAALLERLLTYWAEEVRSRGYEVYHLFIGATGFHEVEQCFRTLDALLYPDRGSGAGG